MKVIFKTETKILTELELDDITDDIENELETTYGDKPIKKYELTFNEGVVVKDCNRLEDISDKMVSVLTITIE